MCIEKQKFLSVFFCVVYVANIYIHFGIIFVLYQTWEPRWKQPLTADR